MDVKKLVEEVLIDLGNNRTLTDVSSKIQIIVRLLGDSKLKEWYDHEFVSGYRGDELPDYRVSRAADIRANYIVPQGLGLLTMTGQSVPVANLGAEKYNEIMTVRFYDTISAIIEYSKNPKDIIMSLTPYETYMIQDVLGRVQIQNAYKLLSPSTLKTIIDSVQDRIIDLFMDLDERVFNGELDLKSNSTKEEIHQVITNNITAGIVQTGSGAKEASDSMVTAITEIQLSSELIDKLLSLSDEIDKVVQKTESQNKETIQDLADLKAELSSSKPRRRILRNTFKAIAWGATISSKTFIEEIVKKALDLLQ